MEAELPVYQLNLPPSMKLVELPKRTRMVFVAPGADIDEAQERASAVLDPESKSLRAVEGQ